MNYWEKKACIMKLQTLVIKNFRGINDLVVPFDGKCTVLYGENGIGKSSILNAIDILFARLITRITDYRPSLKLSKDDIAFGKEMALIRANFCFNGDCCIDYSRSIYRKAEKRIHSVGSLNQFADLFSELYLSESASKECMPIFANYGVNRAVLDIPLRISKKHSLIRSVLTGWDGCAGGNQAKRQIALLR